MRQNKRLTRKFFILQHHKYPHTLEEFYKENQEKLRLQIEHEAKIHFAFDRPSISIPWLKQLMSSNPKKKKKIIIIIIIILSRRFPRRMTMHIDSMATIEALNQGSVSERKRIKMQGRTWKSFIKTVLVEKKDRIKRKRIKMQGRTWKSFIKTALVEKKDRISIQHVKAHTRGLANSEQQGTIMQIRWPRNS